MIMASTISHRSVRSMPATTLREVHARTPAAYIQFQRGLKEANGSHQHSAKAGEDSKIAVAVHEIETRVAEEILGGGKQPIVSLADDNS